MQAKPSDTDCIYLISVDVLANNSVELHFQLNTTTEFKIISIKLKPWSQQ